MIGLRSPYWVSVLILFRKSLYLDFAFLVLNSGEEYEREIEETVNVCLSGCELLGICDHYIAGLAVGRVHGTTPTRISTSFRPDIIANPLRP
jgi:hypothetical protein